MAATIFSHTDADAPVLTGEPGAVANLLRKCLVDGYGSGSEEKTPLGWSMQWHTDTNAQAVFTSADPAATGMHLVVDDRGQGEPFGGQIAQEDARVCVCWGAEDFTGWDANGDPEMVGRFPTAAQKIDTNLNPVDIHKSDSLDNTARPWFLLGDEKSFYLCVRGSYADDWAIDGSHVYSCTYFFFGDLEAASAIDSIPCAIFGCNTSTGTGNSWVTRAPWLSANPGTIYGYMPQKIHEASEVPIVQCLYTTDDPLNRQGPDFYRVNSQTVRPLSLRKEPVVSERNRDESEFESLRGRLPYFRAPWMDLNDWSIYENFWGEATGTARRVVDLGGGLGEHLVVPSSHAANSNGLFFFSLGER